MGTSIWPTSTERIGKSESFACTSPQQLPTGAPLPLLLAHWPSTEAHPKNIGNGLIPIVTKAGPPCSESHLLAGQWLSSRHSQLLRWDLAEGFLSTTAGREISAPRSCTSRNIFTTGAMLCLPIPRSEERRV